MAGLIQKGGETNKRLGAISRIRILIADNNPIYSEGLIAQCQQPGIELVGIARTSSETLTLIQSKHPEIVVLEIAVDGLRVLENLPEHRKPKILVFTTVTDVETIRRSRSLGVSYYMLKPQMTPVLLRRIRQCAEEPIARSPLLPPINERIQDILSRLGISNNTNGCQYLETAINLALSKPDIMWEITEALYPSIAARHNTTRSRVEAAIRYAITAGWPNANTQLAHRVFGYRCDPNKDRPTNAEFINLVAQYTKQVGMS